MVLGAHGQCAVCSADADVITRGSIIITSPLVTTLSDSLAANVDGLSNVMSWAAFSRGWRGGEKGGGGEGARGRQCVRNGVFS